VDEETREALDELRRRVDDELGELRADVSEHDRSLMDLLRGRPRWATTTGDGAELEPNELIRRIDTAAATLERVLDDDEVKLWERLLRLAPSTRGLIGKLLSIPSGDERAAVAYCLTVDDDERGELLAQIAVAEQQEIDAAETG
jgi:hypothetical protein